MKKNNLLIFLLLLGLASCNLSNKDKKRQIINELKRFSNEFKKVDSLNLFKEELLPVIKLNQEHRFEITPCEFKYNGKVFRLGGNVKELVSVFGQPSRKPMHEYSYVWDNYGFSVLLNRHTKETSEFRICFDSESWIDPTDSTTTISHTSFKGGILIDGVVLGNGLPFVEFKKQLIENGSEIDFRGFYRDNLYIYSYDCDYDGDIKNTSDKNHAIIIDGTEDSSQYSSIHLNDSRAIYRLQMEHEKK